jgi:hypothetical protein
MEGLGAGLETIPVALVSEWVAGRKDNISSFPGSKGLAIEARDR